MKIKSEMLPIKQVLKNTVPKELALTGRMESWINDEYSRLPASCTVFHVEDRTYGRDGIEDSWLFTSHGLRYAAGVAIDLSGLSKSLIGNTSYDKQIVLQLSPNHPEADEWRKLDNTQYVKYVFGNRSDFSIVRDSMEGEYGIEDSWIETSKSVGVNRECRFDLSQIRPKGTDNGKGLIASGVISFAKFYEAIARFRIEGGLVNLMRIFSLINQELRRGGVFKNGAITLFLNYDNPSIFDYLHIPSHQLPWAKRAVYVDEGVLNHKVIFDIIQGVNNGSIWLAKIVYDQFGNRLFSNVCLEVLLAHRATCILSPVNVGLFRCFETITQDLIRAFKSSMHWLCRTHAITGVASKGHYLKPSEDRQVGLGIIGLANLLAMHKITYEDFAFALTELLNAFDDPDGIYLSNPLVIDHQCPDKAFILANAFFEAYMEASEVAKDYGMDRAFAIAPTASVAYRHKDADGFTTAPEISPPISYEVDRDSDTFGVETFEYHPRTEIAKNVRWEVQWTLLNAFQRLQNIRGLGHAISSNIWSSKRVNRDFIEEFLASNLLTTYYRISVDQEALDKSEVVTPESNEEKLRGLYDDYDEGLDDTNDSSDSSAAVCNLNFGITTPGDDPQYCSACGG